MDIQNFGRISILISLIFFSIHCQESMPVSVSLQSSLSQSNDSSELSEAIYQCFSESDPAVLMPYMRREVLMTNDFGEEIRAQWEVLNDLALFFKKHLFASFKIKHHATAKGGKSEFLVGMYIDQEGDEFRIEISAMNCFIDEIDICLVNENM